jgi:hypothetical protein
MELEISTKDFDDKVALAVSTVKITGMEDQTAKNIIMAACVRTVPMPKAHTWPRTATIAVPTATNTSTKTAMTSTRTHAVRKSQT